MIMLGAFFHVNVKGDVVAVTETDAGDGGSSIFLFFQSLAYLAGFSSITNPTLKR